MEKIKVKVSPQQLASDPTASVWVNASAGSGKTKVLTDRLLRILLQGTDPSQILCLTFTKTAAAEMTQRLYKELSLWAITNEQERSDVLKKLLGRKPTTIELEKAKSCLYDIDNSLPGLSIQTFHSFCQNILHKFPLEANLHPGFNLLDENQQKEELLKLRQKILYEKTNLNPFLETLSDLMPENSFEELIDEIISKKISFYQLFKQYPSIEACKEKHKSFILSGDYSQSNNSSFYKIQESLYKEIQQNIKDFLHSITSKTPFTTTEEKFWNQLRTLVKTTHLFSWSELKSILLTKTGSIKSRLISKKTQEKHPSILVSLENLTSIFQKLLEREKTLITSISTQTVLHLAYEFLQLYDKAKARKNSLDFDDVLLKTLSLLTNDVFGPTVMHKESQSISHILMDEAQDTSPIQWEIISTLVQDFLSADTAKTFFAVGDAKQSIYSFQGADHTLFQVMHSHFKTFHKNMNLPWRDITLDMSYRSTPQVLEMVDQVFENIPTSYKLQNTKVQHIAFRKNHEGGTHSWPLIPKPSRKTLESSSIESPTAYMQQELANKIACEINAWLESKIILPSTGKCITPADIIILTRKRSSLSKYLTHELKEHGIFVNGEDRVKLWEHLAIQDLFYIGKWAIEPYDDFALTVILKSPLVRLQEPDILYLCTNRKEKSLWEFLQDKKNNYKKTVSFLKKLLEKSRNQNPYNFYTYLLQGKNLRGIYKKIFGTSVEVYLSLFLEQLFNEKCKSSGLDALNTFLTSIWLNKDNSYPSPLEDQQCIQIMTVHASKGRQAPIVILPDTADVPQINDKLLWHEEPNKENIVLFPPSRSLLPKNLLYILEKKKEQQLQEYFRLFYVALTRAQDHLILTGIDSIKKSSLNWYTLAHSYTSKKAPLYTKVTKTTSIDSIKIEEKKHKEEQDFSTLLSPILNEEDLHPFISVTDAFNSYKSNSNDLPKKEHTLSSFRVEQLKGTIIHKILESCPFNSIEELKKRVFVEIDISSKLYPFLKINPKIIVDEIWSLQNTSPIDKILSLPYQSEYSIVGINDKKPYKGRIDRLTFDKNSKTLYVIDFKTSTLTPSSPKEILFSHKQQVSLYTKMLASTFPNLKLIPTLIYTKKPSIFFV